MPTDLDTVFNKGNNSTELFIYVHIKNINKICSWKIK